MRTFTLKNICNCSTEQQGVVLEIRNEYNIRKEMYTDRLISNDEHYSYIENLRNDKSRVTFVVLSDNTDPVGVLSISQIDRTHLKCDWAFYLTSNTRGGVGSAMELFLIDFVFDRLGMKKLNCEVIETNTAVVSLHKKFGFIEEGLRRSNIIKNGARVGVYLLGLTESDWRQQRPNIKQQIGRKIENIKIVFDEPEFKL